MTTRILPLLAALSLLAASAQPSAERRLQSGAAGSTKTAAAKSGDAQLQLVTGVIKETYCEGPDPDLFTLRLLLRLSFTNTGRQKVILERGAKLVPVIRVSKTAQDAFANRLETTLNNYIITNHGRASAVPKRPPLGGFVILASGQSYETTAEISIPVPRAEPIPAAINSGSHYLQIGVWTWYESQSAAEASRKQWQAEGFLWSETILSQPMPITVRQQPKPADCLCENPTVGESAAINIARARISQLNGSFALDGPVIIEQGCEWYVIFESQVKEPDPMRLTFIIDRTSGNILGEFQ